MKNSISGCDLLSILIVFALLASITFPIKCERLKYERRETVARSFAQKSQSDPQKKNPDYRIWRIFTPKDRKGLPLAFVSVNSEHFNRETMATLARLLNKEFKQKGKIRAILFDDPDLARDYASGANDPDGMEKYVRGLYFLDRSKPEEYIQFSSNRNKPRDEIEIRLTPKR